jgi:pyrroloquinoline quinone (PQQ) biosynthesis protein C
MPFSSRHEVFWTELEKLRERWDVLQHPFYTRWSAGGLDSSELRLYAREYEHAVVAIAVASRRAADRAEGALTGDLEEHARAEEAHIDLWQQFALATGWGHGDAWCYGEDPLRETVACARTWGGGKGRTPAQDLTALYAIESAQPAISQAKLDGLIEHYGFQDGRDTEYFRVHVEQDEQHARLVRAALDPLLAGEEVPALIRQAEAVHRSYWELLSGLDS